jgi:competence protein ComEC
MVDTKPPDFSHLDGEDITVVGIVAGKEYRSYEWGDILLIKLKPETGGFILCYLAEPDIVPQLGSTVQMTGRVRVFELATNPGQFSAAHYYQIMKTDFRLYNAEIVAYGADYDRFREWLFGIKAKMGETIDSFFVAEKASVMRAMLLGESGQTDSELKAMYQRNGIVHILTVSGLHISIIGLGLYKFLRRITVPLLLAAPLAIAVMYGYGVMIDMGAPSFRAIVMFALRMTAHLAKRSYDLLTALAVAAVLILIEQPLYLFHSGFLFSFTAVLAIGVLMPAISYQLADKKANRPKVLKVKRKISLSLFEKVKQSFLTTLLISISTLPIYFSFYYEFPLYSIVLNLVVIPPMTLVMICGIVTVTLGMAVPILGKITAVIPSVILDFYYFMCELADQMPQSRLIMGKPLTWQIAVFIALLLLIVVTHRKLRKLLRYLLLSVAVLVMLWRPPLGLTVTFLDVGQGDAVFVATPDRRHYLIDGGSNSVSSVGQYRLLPFLKSQGVSQVDAWIITHAHNDHYSAFPEIIAQIKSGGVKIVHLILPDICETVRDGNYLFLVETAREAGIAVSYMGRGQSFLMDKEGEVAVKSLHPEEGAVWGEVNHSSLVLLLEFHQFSLLLTGDIEGRAEAELVRYLREEGEGGEVTVLKVAHHGSRGASSKEFLALTSPDIAIISAARVNSYGHPHQESLARLADENTVIFATGDSGAITIETDGMKMRLDEFLR